MRVLVTGGAGFIGSHFVDKLVRDGYRVRVTDNLSSGRVEKYKRLELAVDVAKELNLKLIIIGKGPYKEKLVRYASKVYRGGVEFLELQPREKYLELLSRARYAINPSKHEAFSMFTAEALAMETPAIVSKEIAENLEALARPLVKDLVVAEKAQIKTWDEVLLIYVKELYKTLGK
jgi:glycosyltransferase involved in cell wall biosynthesis